MLVQPVRQRRRATTIVESALVFPALILFLFGLVIGGLGVFRYQEVASLAREAARYASVRGTNYAAATGQAPATADTIYANAIKPNLVSLDPNQVSTNVTWNTDNRPGSTVSV